MEMALLLLLAAINKASRNRIDVRDPAMLGMLDGLLPLLVRAMRSRHGSVASAALRIFSVLVPLPLPGACRHSLCCLPCWLNFCTVSCVCVIKRRPKSLK